MFPPPKIMLTGLILFWCACSAWSNGGIFIKENYVQAGITLSYRDFWFTKVKKFND